MRRGVDRCPEIYGRDSSRLKTDQEDEDGSGQARGSDCYEGAGDPDLLLPYGMNALLLQQFKRDNEDGEIEEFLYVKMETESARFKPAFKKKGDTPDARPLEKEDVHRAILHLKNLLIPEKDKSGLSRHAEKYGDIPKEIRDNYDNLRRQLAGNPEILSLVEMPGDFTRSWKKLWLKKKYKGIQVAEMAKRIDRLRPLLRDLANPDVREMLGVDAEMVEAVQTFVGAWDQVARDHWGPSYERDVHRRIGDEVILREEDI